MIPLAAMLCSQGLCGDKRNCPIQNLSAMMMDPVRRGPKYFICSIHRCEMLMFLFSAFLLVSIVFFSKFKNNWTSLRKTSGQVYVQIPLKGLMITFEPIKSIKCSPLREQKECGLSAMQRGRQHWEAIWLQNK